MKKSVHISVIQKPKNFNKNKQLDLIVLGQESSFDVKLSSTNIRVAKHLCPEL